MKMKYLLIVTGILIASMGCKSKVSNNQNVDSYKNIEVTEARTMIAGKSDLVILDVRTPDEVEQGTIPGAMVIDYYDNDFDAKIAILDKSKPYLVYCRSGGRSVGASEKMIQAGFKDVTNLKGGYNAWVQK